MAISPARIVAVAVLQEIDANRHSQAADLLFKFSSQHKLSDEDGRLARSLVFGVLRYAPTLDFWYGKHLKQPVDKLQPELKMLLRMATFQHYMLSKIPAYANVNDAVELARKQFRLKQPQVSFLNAVLRKVTTEVVPPELPTGNRMADLCIRYGFPQVYVRLLVERFGIHKAVAIMEASKAEPPLTIRVNQLQTTSAELQASLTEDGFEVYPSELSSETLIVRPGTASHSLFETTEFASGQFYVQDEASQMVARIAAPQAGERILDLCAAPGGKTTHMAELAGGAADITATDISPDRLHLVEENLQRLKTPGVTVIPLDSALADEQLYDVVLVDAPCSGSGTVRRNPEIAYRLSPEAFAHHAGRQLPVLGAAAACVRPGGRIIYSTCSISREENRDVVKQFLQSYPQFKIIKPAADLMGNNEILVPGESGFYCTWPAHPDIDGFEAVVLQKRLEETKD